MRTIAFYLPQFHPIPENDAWWGTGFTEWRNVTRAKPLFRGHYQPHLPADLGFYDLRLPEVREAQAAMAAAHGISGFCYYHYWFHGTRLLNRPLDEVLTSGKPDFPFCVCWANESWSRRWDGRDDFVLIGQRYSPGDDQRHIEHLIQLFRDDRYIKIDGRPLFLVYRTAQFPNAAQTAALWRDACLKAGFPGLYLVRVESWKHATPPETDGFDADLEFAPDLSVLPRAIGHRWELVVKVYDRLNLWGVLPSSVYLANRILRYDTLVDAMLAKPPVGYKRFRCVTPGWDNSPRRVGRDVTAELFIGARIFHDSTPETYERWLRAAAHETRERFRGDEQILFINAWNEWAEGNHLEPDLRWGHAYLESTARVLKPPRAEGR
jgi:lipopolysaccharide biosynthesis protein